MHLGSSLDVPWDCCCPRQQQPSPGSPCAQTIFRATAVGTQCICLPEWILLSPMFALGHSNENELSPFQQSPGYSRTQV